MAKRIPGGVKVVIDLRHRGTPELKLDRYFLFPYGVLLR